MVHENTWVLNSHPKTVKSKNKIYKDDKFYKPKLFELNTQIPYFLLRGNCSPKPTHFPQEMNIGQ